MYKGDKLYFSGFNNLNAVITDLIKNHGLNQATEVIVGGDSAGGLATWIHTDYWKSRLPPTTHVVGTPDSGFFIEKNSATKHYANDLRWVFQQMNGTAGLHPDCVAHSSDPSACIFAQNTAPFCRAPMFVLQSKYDEYQINAILGSTEPSAVNAFGVEFTNTIKMSLSSLKEVGLFLDSCVHHCGGWGVGEDGDYKIVIEGMTGLEAFISWYNNEKDKIWEQMDLYPCQECCRGGGK